MRSGARLDYGGDGGGVVPFKAVVVVACLKQVLRRSSLFCDVGNGKRERQKESERAAF